MGREERVALTHVADKNVVQLVRDETRLA